MPKLFGVGKEKEYIAEHLSNLVRGNVDIVDALRSVSEEIKSKSMKRVLGYMIEDIDSGSSVWKAFEMSGLFKEHTLALIRIGEETGRLSENLQVVATESAKSREFTSKVRAAMMYPIFVLGLTVVIGVGIAWFILPKLATVFAQLAIDLPLITQILIRIGEVLQSHGQYIIPVAIIGLVLFVFFLFVYRKTRFIGQAILFKIPGIDKLMQEIEIARFGFLFGTLLNVGLPISQAVDSLSHITEFRPYKKLYVHIKESITSGNSFKETFDSYPAIKKLLPISVQQMIISAEQSGNLAKALLQVGATADKKTEGMTKNLTVILEPILLVIVWLGVVGVALGVIMPIYGLVGGLNGPQNSVGVEPAVTEEAVLLSEDISFEDILKDTESNSTDSTLLKLRGAQATLEILPTGPGYLNVRDKPGLYGVVLKRVSPGEIYAFTEISEDGEWYKISLDNDLTGWVFEKYIEEINQSHQAGQEKNEDGL